MTRSDRMRHIIRMTVLGVKPSILQESPVFPPAHDTLDSAIAVRDDRPDGAGVVKGVWQRQKRMRRIKIISRKYDGSLRDEYEAFLVAEDEEKLVVYTPPGTMDYDYRKQAWFEAPDGLLELYFKARWYTVWHICKQNSHVNQIYTHISMPPLVTATGIEWVNLDLDYRVHLDGRIERLDGKSM